MQTQPAFLAAVVLGGLLLPQGVDALDDLLTSPILFRGDATTAYRDPAAIYHEDVFHLFFTLVQAGDHGQPWMFTASSKSGDLQTWTPPHILTPKDRNLNFSGPGLAWSQDLRNWDWPGKAESTSAHSVPQTLTKPVTTPQASAGQSPLVATFSIVGFDPASEAMGVAVQSKFFGVGTVVPWAKAKVGAIATQSYANIDYGPDGLALLSKGHSARETLEKLTQADPGRAKRQLGVVDAQGRVASFTGGECNAWAGHFEGTNFCVQGNILAGKEVVSDMAQAYINAQEKPQSELADWLTAALAAGQAAGGDTRGQQSAALLVVREGKGYDGKNDRFIDLRVEDHPRPIEELARLLAIHKRFRER